MFQFESLAAFMAMDGHGIYVWIAYLVSVALMIWLLVQPRIKYRQLKSDIRRQQQRESIRQQTMESK